MSTVTTIDLNRDQFKEEQIEWLNNKHGVHVRAEKMGMHMENAVMAAKTLFAFPKKCLAETCKSYRHKTTGNKGAHPSYQVGN